MLTASKVTHDKELVTILLTDGEKAVGKKQENFGVLLVVLLLKLAA